MSQSIASSCVVKGRMMRPVIFTTVAYTTRWMGDKPTIADAATKGLWCCASSFSASTTRWSNVDPDTSVRSSTPAGCRWRSMKTRASSIARSPSSTVETLEKAWKTIGVPRWVTMRTRPMSGWYDNPAEEGSVKAMQLAARLPFFELEARGTTVAREVRGGAATFLTMAYILFANPAILAAAGMPFRPVVAATALASAAASLLMGLAANFPIALAPGMGLNAVVAYQVARAAGSWQAAMGIVVLGGF